MHVYYYGGQTYERFAQRTSLYSPPLSSSLLPLDPSIYFRSLSVAFVEYFVNSHQQDGRFCTRRVRESKPQFIPLLE